MSYAKLNIWLRDLRCCPKNFWKVELVVKTCGGDYLVDFNPDVIAKLKAAYPEHIVERGSRDGETTIVIRHPEYKLWIKHIEIDVPPGCYIIRAWVCWQNLWSDRAMVIVGCGGEACVNLIVPLGRNCIRDAAIPFGVLAQNLPPDKVRIAFEMLMKAGQMPKEAILKELNDLTKELDAVKVGDAPEYAKGFRFVENLIKDIKIDDC